MTLKLHADYMPPDLLQSVRWYQPVRSGPTWYYFEEVTDLVPGTTDTPLHLVDPLLRPIIQGLNEAGIQTFASCQGHFQTPEDIDKIYAQLQVDAAHIQTVGVKMRDLLTGETVNYIDPEYKLPSLDALCSNLAAFVGQGYFSFAVGSLVGLTDLLRALPFAGGRVTFGQRYGLIQINVYMATTEATQEAQWADLAEAVLSVLPRVTVKQSMAQKVQTLYTSFQKDHAHLNFWLRTLSHIQFMMAQLLTWFLLYVAWKGGLDQSWTKALLVLMGVAIGSFSLFTYQRKQALVDKITSSTDEF